MKTKVITIAIGCALASGCANVGGESALGKAGDVNDRITERVVLTLCDPLRQPALQRRYADEPDKLAAIKELCSG